MRSLLRATTLLLAAMIGQGALANETGYTEAFAVFHFTDTYYGQPVESVAVHSGLVSEYGMLPPYTTDTKWVDVRHEQMSRQGDHFFLKLRFNQQNLILGCCNIEAMIKGLAVQYWVTLKDGSTRISTTTFYPNSDPRYRTQDEGGIRDWFESATDASETIIRFSNTGFIGIR